MICRISTSSLLILIILLNSCQVPDNGVDGESGRLILRLTDAPFPYTRVAEVNVVISQIRLIKEDQQESNDLNEDAVLELMEAPVRINLLHLTNGVTLTLTNSDIPDGSYKGIEIYLEEVGITLKDQTKLDLTPSPGRSRGRAVYLPEQIDVASGLTTDLLLDFDVSRSFITRFSSSASMGIAGFVFKPVIHVSDNARSGSLSGIITSSQNHKISRLEGAQVTLMSADTVLTSTFTEFAGMYTILGLQPGRYEVIAIHDGLATDSGTSVIIKADQKTNQSLVLNALK